MVNFVKFGNSVVNLDQVNEIALVKYGASSTVFFYGNSGEDSNVILRFDGEQAEIVWKWVNETLVLHSLDVYKS